MTITTFNGFDLNCFTTGFLEAVDSETLHKLIAISESALVAVLGDWSQPWDLCYPVSAKKEWQPRKGETYYKAGARWYREHRQEFFDAVVAEAKYRAEAHKESAV